MIGTSGGGVEALKTLVSGLPKDLPAAVFAVMHIQPSRRSAMPEILSANGQLKVLSPEYSQAFQHGRLYIAPPDFHLLLEPDERLALWHGPKETYFRPAINPLFRSAAESYRDRVIGVILTGSLDDGVAGLAAVKQHGGLAVVQHPDDARFPNMPRTAILRVQVDHVARLADIPRLLIQLSGEI